MKIVVLARVGWCAFILFGLASWVLLELEKRDPYFIRHYSHQPMDGWTRFATTWAFVFALIPLLWYPLMRRRDGLALGGGCLLMILAALAMVIGHFFIGPGIQM